MTRREGCDVAIVGNGVLAMIVATALSVLRRGCRIRIFECHADDTVGPLPIPELVRLDDVPAAIRQLLDNAIVRRWNQCHVAYPATVETDRGVFALLDPQQFRLDILARDHDAIVFEPARIEADGTLATATGAFGRGAVIDEAAFWPAALIRRNSTRAYRDLPGRHDLRDPVAADFVSTADRSAFLELIPLNDGVVRAHEIMLGGNLSGEDRVPRHEAGSIGGTVPLLANHAARLASLLVELPVIDGPSIDAIRNRLVRDLALQIGELRRRAA